MKKLFILLITGLMGLSSCISSKNTLGRTDELVASFTPMCLEYDGHDRKNGVFYFSDPTGSWNIQMFEKGKNVDHMVYYMTNDYAVSFFNYIEGSGNYQCSDRVCVGTEVTYEFIDLGQGQEIIVTPSVQH